jgi:hypothetical protein
VAVLAVNPHNPALAASEIVTTGSLTRAQPIADGEVWTTRMTGIPLEGSPPRPDCAMKRRGPRCDCPVRPERAFHSPVRVNDQPEAHPAARSDTFSAVPYNALYCCGAMLVS